MTEAWQTDKPLTVQYGMVRGQGFHYWFIGGENFGNSAGDFEGPFETLDAAREAAEKIAKAENLPIEASEEEGRDDAPEGLREEDVRFPFKVEMVEFRNDQWGVRSVITGMTVEEAHEFGERLADFFEEFNRLMKKEDE
jgi:hypothetical protein